MKKHNSMYFGIKHLANKIVLALTWWFSSLKGSLYLRFNSDSFSPPNC